MLCNACFDNLKVNPDDDPCASCRERTRLALVRSEREVEDDG